MEKIGKKLLEWKQKLLSQGGRLVLLRHVLSSMPIHLLSVLHTPKAVIKKLNSLFASFSRVMLMGLVRGNGDRGESFVLLLKREGWVFGILRRFKSPFFLSLFGI